jgi:hypothetical protein
MFSGMDWMVVYILSCLRNNWRMDHQQNLEDNYIASHGLQSRTWHSLHRDCLVDMDLKNIIKIDSKGYELMKIMLLYRKMWYI